MSKLLSKVKYPKLYKQGEENIKWAFSHMGTLSNIKKRFIKEKPFKNVTVGMALHVTKETANLVDTLVAGGANVAITGCNPLSTQDDVASALAKHKNVTVFAWKGESAKEYYQNLNLVIKAMRQASKEGQKLATIDDGLDLVTEIHTKHKDLIPKIMGGTEETTTGVIRLQAMDSDKALKYPVVAVNDNQTKHLFDNYYGTGQSTIDGILRASAILLAGKVVLVIGYGDCGRGVAKRASGFDAHVIIAETNPVRALQAWMDGYKVMPIKKAITVADLAITVTGNKHVINIDHIKLAKDKIILANSGHFDVEIDVAGLRKLAKSVVQVRPSLEKFEVGNKTIYLAGEGRLINLAAAEGHPSEVMDLSFAGQALALEYIVKNYQTLNGCVRLPQTIDHQIATLKLSFMGIEHDKLTKEQQKYLVTWEEGT